MPITNARIQELRGKQSQGGCVSIYMQTDPAVNGESMKQNITRLKNVIQSLQRADAGGDGRLDDIVGRLRDLLEDREFWLRQDVGLAIFADKDSCTPVRLPYAINDFAVRSDAFVISPLVAMKSIDRGFYLLDINMKTRPRLFRSTGGTLMEVQASEMPQPFQKIAERYEFNTDLGFKSAPRGEGGDSVSFHGPDVRRELDEKQRAYLRDVAEATDSFLNGRERPLILAGVEERVGNLRKELRYPTVLADYIAGDVGDEKEATLYRKALPIVVAYRRGLIDKAVHDLLESNPRRITAGEEEVLKAAREKRVANVYIPLYRRIADETKPAGTPPAIVVDMPNESVHSLEALVRAVLEQDGVVQAVEKGAYNGLETVMALNRYEAVAG